MKKTCPDCGMVFDCDESTTCWCMDLPPFSKNSKDKDCFCRACLLKKYKKRLLKIL